MSYRRTVMGCCVCMVLASVAMADEPPTSNGDLTAAERVARKAEQQLLQSLEKKIKVEWTDKPLSDVLKSVTTQAEIGLWIDSQALADGGVAQGQEITLNLGETTVATALYFVLTPLELDWSGRSGVLEVSTRAKVEEILFSRVYDVADLCKVLEPQLETLNWQPALPPGMLGMGGGMGGGGMFNVPTVDDLAQPFELPQLGGGGGLGGMGGYPGYASPLMKGWPIASPILRAETALLQLIQGESLGRWQDTDGDGGDVTVLPGRLIVRQNSRAQARIEGLLQGLEEVLLRGAKSKSIKVRRPGYPAAEDAAIMDALAEPVTMDIEDQPLDEVLRGIAKSLGFRCWIDVQALGDEGIATDQQTSTHGKAVALNVMLKHLLTPLQLTYLVHEGTLIVTTRGKADEKLDLLIYNNVDIVGNAAELVPIIEKSTLGPWMTMDGDGGTVHPLGSQLLVIAQSQRSHLEIASLLNDLRQKADPPKESEPSRLVQRIYIVHDQTAIPDLILALPEMVKGWDSQGGSAQRLGHCLSIKQPAAVQDRVGEIIGTLNTAHAYFNPKLPGNPAAPTKAAAAPATEPAAATPVKPAPNP